MFNISPSRCKNIKNKFNFTNCLITYKDFVPECLRDFLYTRETKKSISVISLNDYYENTLSDQDESEYL